MEVVQSCGGDHQYFGGGGVSSVLHGDIISTVGDAMRIMEGIRSADEDTLIIYPQ